MPVSGALTDGLTAAVAWPTGAAPGAVAAPAEPASRVRGHRRARAGFGRGCGHERRPLDRRRGAQDDGGPTGRHLELAEVAPLEDRGELVDEGEQGGVGRVRGREVGRGVGATDRVRRQDVRRHGIRGGHLRVAGADGHALHEVAGLGHRRLLHGPGLARRTGSPDSPGSPDCCSSLTPPTSGRPGPCSGRRTRTSWNRDPHSRRVATRGVRSRPSAYRSGSSRLIVGGTIPSRSARS